MTLNFRNYWRKLLITGNSRTALLCSGYDNDECLGAKMVHLSRQINTLRQRMEDENQESLSIIWKIIILLTFHISTSLNCVTLHVGFISSKTQFQLHAGIFRGQIWDFCPSRRWPFDTRSVTESPCIIQDIFVMDRVQSNGSFRMVLQMSSWSTSCWNI